MEEQKVFRVMAWQQCRQKNREHDARVIGILGRIFLQSAQLEIDGCAGRTPLLIRDAE
jgi:hypothetical protein